MRLFDRLAIWWLRRQGVSVIMNCLIENRGADGIFIGDIGETSGPLTVTGNTILRGV